MNHHVDEQFWHVQQHVKDTILQLYKGYFKEKYPRVLASEMITLEKEMTSDLADLDPTVTRKVLVHMYEPKDLEALEPRCISILKYSVLVKTVLEF